MEELLGEGLPERMFVNDLLVKNCPQVQPQLITTWLRAFKEMPAYS